MNSTSEEKIQKNLVETPHGQEIVHRRLVQRVGLVSALLIALVAFLMWLQPADRAVLLRSLLANRLFVFLLVVFSLLTVSLLWSTGQRLDEWVFRFFNLRGFHALWLDRAMWLGTQIGNMGFALALAAITYILGYHAFAIKLVLGVLSLWLLVEIIKALTDRARPFNLLRETRIIGWREPGLSFPSGHTAQTFFIMFLVSQNFSLMPWATVALFGVAAFVGLTRIYVGAHYPRDVLAGAVLGLVWGVVGALMFPYI